MRRFLALFFADGDLTDFGLTLVSLVAFAGFIAVLAQ